MTIYVPNICLYLYTLPIYVVSSYQWCMPRHATSEHASRGPNTPPLLREHLECVLDRDTLHSSNNSNSHAFFTSTQISQIDCWDCPYRVVCFITIRKPYCPPSSCNRWETLVFLVSWQINQLHCPGTDPVVGHISNGLHPLPNRRLYLYRIQKKSSYSNSSVATGRAKEKKEEEAAAASSCQRLQPPIPKPINDQLTTDWQPIHDNNKTDNKNNQKQLYKSIFWLFLFYFCCYFFVWNFCPFVA